VTDQAYRYCGYEVRYIRKHPEGEYIVFFRENASRLSFGPFRSKLRWVHAKRFVFLGAGSMGSTEIVLRSRNEGLSTSPRVGKGLSANGGALAFGYDLDHSIGQVNPRERPGPTISGMVECEDKDDWERSFIVQDGSWPRFMDTFFRITKPMLLITIPSYVSMRKTLKSILSILDPFTTALRRTQVYLALGHDTSCGSLTLQNDVPLLDMRGVESKANNTRIKKLLIEMTHVFEGLYIEQGCKVAVHPLGGLGYASDGTGRTGSVGHTGELFTGKGRSVHAGLCALDGAVISRSLAANPLATITAVAERSVELLAEKNGLHIDLTSTKKSSMPRRDDLVTFAEKMEGAIDFGGNCVPMILYADVEISSNRRTGRGKAIGRLSGTLHCPYLSVDQLLITDGSFSLFEEDEVEACQSLMVYQFTAIAINGERYAMVGKKLLNASATLSFTKTWKATTTLFLSIADTDGHAIGFGTLHLSLRNVIDQMRTMTTSGGTISSRRICLIDFLRTFASGTLEKFLSPLAPLQYPEHFQNDKVLPGHPQKISPKLEIDVKALDGVTSTLRIWEPLGSCNDSGVVHDVLFIPGTSVSHLFFASPFIKQNAIEYFTQKGYRCWCATPRFCKQDPNRADSSHAWTGYDGRLDIAAALEEINRYSVAHSARSLPPCVFAHCAGSMGLASGLLGGTIHRSSVSGITASQVFLHPVLQPLNEFKAHLPLTRLYQMVAGDWLPLVLTKELALRDTVQSTLDTLLRLYPLTDKREICSSTVCHRNSLVFSRLWSHRNINKATHDNQQYIFGGTSGTCLERMASNCRYQTLRDNDGNDLVTDENLARLREIPIFLFSGAQSNVFKPASTLRTY
jgi:hypothetical protein